MFNVDKHTHIYIYIYTYIHIYIYIYIYIYIRMIVSRLSGGLQAARAHLPQQPQGRVGGPGPQDVGGYRWLRYCCLELLDRELPV